MPDLAALFIAPQLAAQLGPEDAAAALKELSALQAALTAQLGREPAKTTPKPALMDRLLDVDEVAPLLGVKVRWLYAHAKEFPFTRRLGRKTLRFSEAGLQRYLATLRP